MSMANYLETLLLNWAFNRVVPTQATNFYLGLHIGDPGETGANEQVTGTDATYVRQEVVFGADAASGVISNTAALSYDPTASYTVTYVSIWDAATVGNCYFTGALAVPRAISNGSPIAFAIGDINVSLD